MTQLTTQSQMRLMDTRSPSTARSQREIAGLSDAGPTVGNRKNDHLGSARPSTNTASQMLNTLEERSRRWSGRKGDV